HLEDYCEKTFGADVVWALTVDGAPSAWPIPLPRGPVIPLETAELVDPRGPAQAVTDAVLDLATSPARLYPPLEGWPPAGAHAWVRTRVHYTAGGAGRARP